MHATLRWMPALLSAAALAPGCGDDPVRPPVPFWSPVALPDVGDGGLLGIAARGTRVVAVGTRGASNSLRPLVVEASASGWVEVPVAALPAATALLDVALTEAGGAIAVGTTRIGASSYAPLVADERGGWSAVTLPVVGVLNAVAAGRGDTLRAVGTAAGGLAAWSTAPGSWQRDRAGFTTAQEKGLLAVHGGDGIFHACGWDDGGPPYLVVRRHAGAWAAVPAPGSGSPDAGTSVEYRAILADGGALWLGGTIETFATGAHEPLLARRAGDEWISIVLPERGAVQSVNDVLRAANGDVYLACGEDVGRVLRWDGARWHDEGPGTPGQILALAQAADGRVYAAGRSGAAGQAPRPLLLVRRP